MNLGNQLVYDGVSYPNRRTVRRCGWSLPDFLSLSPQRTTLLCRLTIFYCPSINSRCTVKKISTVVL